MLETYTERIVTMLVIAGLAFVLPYVLRAKQWQKKCDDFQAIRERAEAEGEGWTLGAGMTSYRSNMGGEVPTPGLMESYQDRTRMKFNRPK